MFYKSLILVSNCHTDFRVRHWFFLGYFIHCCYCFIRIEMNVSVEIRWQDKWYMMLRSVPRPVKETPDKAAGVRGELLSTRTHLTNKVNILCSDCILPIKSIWEGFFPLKFPKNSNIKTKQFILTINCILSCFMQVWM